MFPYIDTRQWHAGPVQLHPFVILLAMAVGTGYLVGVWRCGLRGISREQLSALALWMFGMGFLFSYVIALAYLPNVIVDLVRHPTRIAMTSWGLSSFGGFAGGLLGVAIYSHLRRLDSEQRLILLDVAGFSVPFGWAFGRLGCYLVHDHPGERTTSWLGVRYPEGVRFDLGLLELLFLITMCAVFIWLDRKPRPDGFFTAAFLIPYGVFRLLEDPLRIDPPRYLGFTVDQFAATGMIAVGLFAICNRHRCRISACFRHVTSAVGSLGTGTR